MTLKIKNALNEENIIYSSIYEQQQKVIKTLINQNQSLKQMKFKQPIIQTNLS